MENRAETASDDARPASVTAPVMSGTTHFFAQEKQATSPPVHHLHPDAARDEPCGQRFQVRRVHAHGGLGTVLVAYDCELDREVALKQIQEQRADDLTSRARFLFEAKITGALEHPGIVPVYSLGTYVDGRPFYAMRLIKGTNLREAVQQFHRAGEPDRDAGYRSVELRKLLRRFLDACNAIDYAHGRGILHRDLKPSNIMVGEYGETLVVDWGLAKAMDKRASSEPSTDAVPDPTPESGSDETLPGSKIGTPGFMSPEQAKGDLDRLGPRSDVYSLGATLYFLLTGKNAFSSDNRDLVLTAVQKGEFAPPRVINPAVPRALEAVCLKAMALNPDDRYATARALADDLERWMAGEPVSACPESFLERAGRFVRRHRTATAAAAAALLVAFTGLLVILNVERRANRKLTRSYDKLNQANVDLSNSNDRERARFDLAMATIQKFHTGVSKDFLLKQKEFEPLRKELLSEARESYAKLLTLLEHQPDKRSRVALGKAFAEFGDLMRSIGSNDEGRKAHAQSLAIRGALVRDFAGDSAAQADFGKSLLSIGSDLSGIGQLDEALARCAEARTTFLSLVQAEPSTPSFRQELANCEAQIGAMWRIKGNVNNALESYQRARSLYEQFAGEHLGDIRIEDAYAGCLESIAALARQNGNLSEALELSKQTRKIREKLVRDHPDIADFQAHLAQSCRTIGSILCERGDIPAGLAAYEAALDLRKPLAQKNPNVTAFQRELADSHNSIACVLSDTRQNDRALPHHKEVTTILEALVLRNPSELQLRNDLANAHTNVANLLKSTGEVAAAIVSYHRAMDLEDDLAKNYPQYIDFPHMGARTRINLGDLHGASARPLEALKCYQEARSILESLATQHPNQISVQSDLARAHNSIGAVFVDLARPSDALEFYERAMKAREVLAKNNPSATTFQSALAVSYTNMANQLASAGKSADASDYATRAVKIEQALVAANPNSLAESDALAMSQHNLANILAAAHKSAQALESYEQAAAIWEDLILKNPKDTGYPARLAYSLGISGLYRLAIKQTRQGRSRLQRAVSIMEASPAQTLAAIYNQACYSAALCATAPKPGTDASNAEAREDAERAMKALRRAIAAGFRDFKLLETDHDLDPLRSRQDFRLLMYDVGFPTDPFAP
jgi:eukaryotic-like serine/threonine-protein kinase